MSRIGRMPIAIPAGVTVDIAENNNVTVRSQEREIPPRTDKKSAPQHGSRRNRRFREEA